MTNNSKQIILIFSTPIKRKKIVRFVRSLNKDFSVFDIEEKIIQSLQCNNPNITNMVSLLEYASRIEIEKEWEISINKIVSSISDASSVIVLVSHLIYYKRDNREFFSVFNNKIFMEILSQFPSSYISHVILFIDDIFDIYCRLRQKQELFHHPDYGVITDSNSITPQNYVIWTSSRLNIILNWRLQEIILAQKIAQELNSKFILWGIKQDMRVLTNWISNKQNKLLYISHPITELRQDFKKNNMWSSLAVFIHSIQSRLMKDGIYSVIPTAIDEYRFDKASDGNFTGTLSRRWPLQSDVMHMLKTSEIIESDFNHETIISPLKLNIRDYDYTEENVSVTEIQDYFNGSYASLESSITEQLGNRDHLLVWYTDGIIVIEPYSTKSNKIHSGVLKEIKYIKNVNSKTPNPRRICAIFSEESIRTISKLESFRRIWIEKLKHELKRDFRLDDLDLEQYIDNNGNLLQHGSTPLGDVIPLNTVDRIQKQLPSYKDRSLILGFLHVAIYISEESENICLIILNKYEDFYNYPISRLKDFYNYPISRLKDFFINGEVFDWKTDLLKLIR